MPVKPLKIENFQQGIAPSAYVGFQEIKNIDIFTSPGAALISKKLELSSNIASICTGMIKWFVQDPDSSNGDVYGVDDNGKVYMYDGTTWSVITGHGTTGAHGEGLAIWKGYLFCARSTKLDVMELSSGTWTNDWQTLESSFGNELHPIMAASDDILYIGNAQYVDTLEEVFAQTFDPGNIATYTYNSQDLELRSDYRVTTLEELGSDIAIGTLVGLNNRINIGDTFFWDGASDSWSLNKTIHFAENGVWQMKNLNNTLYTVAGTGITRLFASTFSQATEIKRLTNIKQNPNGTTLRPFPGAIEQKDGELFFGVGRAGGSNGVSPMGVYSYRGGQYVFRHAISTGSDGNNDTLFIGAIKLISGNRYIVSWYDADLGLYGVDILSDFLYTGYKARIDSAIYEVATDDDPITYEHCQISMGKALKAGDKVRVQARYDLGGTFTTIAEFDTVANTGLIGRSVLNVKVSNLSQFKNIQVRTELDAGATEKESPELLSITLS